MSQHITRRRTARRRLLATALTAGLLIPGAVVATPAYADSETLNPLDQSTQFDENQPVLEDSLVEGLQRDAGDSAGTDASGSPSATAEFEHSGPCKQDFMDVPPKSSFYTHITWMACAGLTKGYTDHTFGVNQEITRKEAAVLIYRMSEANHVPGAARDFADVDPRGGDEGFTAISWMHQEHIVRGYVNDGQRWPSFKPEQSISRAELSAYLFRFAGDAGYTPPATAVFPDVPTTAPQYSDISWLSENNMVSGYADGTFRPARKVARGETAKYLYGLETHLKGQPTPPATAPKPARSRRRRSRWRTSTW